MIRSNAGSLADLQRAFQDYVLASSDGFTVQVRDTSKADRVTLLDVYRDGYALRLIEVLTIDFPGVLAMAGPEGFDALARAYVANHPSQHPSVRWFGGQLADFLATTAPYDRTPALAEMARFEWALGEAFDSVDAVAGFAGHMLGAPLDAAERDPRPWHHDRLHECHDVLFASLMALRRDRIVGCKGNRCRRR